MGHSGENAALSRRWAGAAGAAGGATTPDHPTVTPVLPHFVDACTTTAQKEH